MELLNDVVIVSIFGRGNWLASELSSRGWKTTLVDVSEQMGTWQPEDSEGPFGLLEGPGLLASQKSSYELEGETEAAPSGVTLWLPRGPLEFKSQFTAFHLQNHDVPTEVEDYLRVCAKGDEWGREKSAVARLPFSESWLAGWAHQFASTVYRENYCAIKTGRAAPLFQPFSIRHASKNGQMKGLKSCQASGAIVRSNASVRDIRLNGRMIDAIEVGGDHAGIERGRNFVWMLSGEESLRFNTSVHATLFPNGVMGPEWYWTRFQIEMTGQDFSTQLPTWTAVIEDPNLPWTATNLMILKKKEAPRGLDVWMRLPLWMRFDYKHLEQQESEMRKILSYRLPRAEVKTTRMPLEYKNAREKLGPPRFPVFRAEVFGRTETLASPNLFFDGPEHWTSLDPAGAFEHQLSVLNKLENIKKAWDLEERKRLQRSERSEKSSRSGPP